MKKGWLVTFSGMGLNLALGVLYAWSVFGKQFTEAVDKGGFGWSKTQAALPYTIAIAFFAAMMVPAGRLQDKFGPRVVATIGAILTGIGLIVSGFASATNMAPVIIGFGVLAGTGIGLGYASATPAAVKWFPPAKKGLITGIVVSGFGLASVYIAPLSKYLLGTYGVNTSFIILGIAFGVLTGIICQFITNPPTPVVSAAAKSTGNNYKVDYTWREMMKTPTFYLLWIEFACGAMAGLMVIGHLAKIVSVQSNNLIQTGFLFVALLAIFNAGGRLIAGVVSDYIGRMKTILLVFISQAIVMLFFAKYLVVYRLYHRLCRSGFQLWVLPLTLPLHNSRSLGDKESGTQLWNNVHRMGSRWSVWSDPGRKSCRCEWELFDGLHDLRRPPHHRCHSHLFYKGPRKKDGGSVARCSCCENEFAGIGVLLLQQFLSEEAPFLGAFSFIILTVDKWTLSPNG